MLRKVENRAVFIYIGMYVVLFVAQFFVLLFGPTEWTDEAFIRYNSIANLTFYLLTAGLLIILFKDFWIGVFKQFKQHRKEYLVHIALGFLSLIAVSIVINIIYESVGITETSENQALLDEMLNGELFDMISLIVFAVFLAPMVEEMVFRMAGFNYLMRNKDIPVWAIIVITSFLFGLIHVIGAWDIEQIFYYAGLGAVLGFFYYRSKNILVPIGIHMCLNAFATFSMFVIQYQ